MRIIGGKFKGSTLYIPKGKNTRPLKDLARESIFNLLTHSKKIKFVFEGSNILDLYAGTGSFGLECLSRESSFIHFVENNKVSFHVLKKNIEKLKIENKTKIYPNDVFNLLKKFGYQSQKFDLIFCDPPFNNKYINELIDLIFYNNLLNKNGVIILHRNKSSEEKLSSKLNVLDERLYGVSKIIFGNFLI